MNKLISILVVSICVIISVSAAAKLPAEGERFPDTTSVSLGALAVAAFAVVAWRIAELPQPHGGLPGAQDATNPLGLIEQLQGPLQTLCSEAASLDPPQLKQRVDALLDQFILPLGENRNAIVHALGIRQGAELLIEFSLGERLLNRAWSAAADGHLEEAVASLREAQQAFAEIRSTAWSS